MEDKTKELLEKNSELLKALYNFKKEISIEDNDYVAPIIKSLEKKDQKVVANNDDKFLSDDNILEDKTLDLFLSLLEELWASKDMLKIAHKEMQFYNSVFPNGVFFTFDENLYANGISLFGTLTKKLRISNVRDIKIPLKEQSVIRDILISKDLYFGPLFPSFWNSFLSKTLIDSKVCPIVAAVPLFSNNNQLRGAILSCDLNENFSNIKLKIIKFFISEIKRVLNLIAKDDFLSQLV